MSGKNWDRVPIDAQSIDAPLSRAAILLVVTVADTPDGFDDLVSGEQEAPPGVVFENRNGAASSGREHRKLRKPRRMTTAGALSNGL